MKTKNNLLILFICMLAFSCRKRIDNESMGVPGTHNFSSNERVAALTREVATILEEVYTDLKACKEVNAAIFSGHYEDERVPLKDLLFPATSQLYKKELFKKFKVDTGIFRRRFCEILERRPLPLLSAELKPYLKRIDAKPSVVSENMQLLEDSLPSILSASMPVCIYFPYSENFGNIQVYDSLPPNSKLAIILRPTIVYTDREDDRAPGRNPYYCFGAPNNLCYATVVVDDAYAESKPTHIVTTGAVVKTTVPAVLKTELVTRAYHGSSKLSRQMDKFISFSGNGGGSEIKVCRINGFLKTANEQITDFAGDVATIHYTRADIRKRRWKRIFSVWDPNWNYQDIEQVYAVYEDDTYGSKTISGTLNTTVNLPGKLGKIEGELAFKIGIVTQDEVITQKKLDRKSYLRDGMNNQGWGYLPDAEDFLPVLKDWPIIDGGTIWNYTMPYRIY